MPAIAGDMDEFLVVLADDEGVQLTLGGGAVSVVVDANLDAALRTDEVVVLAFEVSMPGADDAWVGHRVVGHGWVDVVLLPVVSKHLDEVAAFVGVYSEITDLEVVDHKSLIRTIIS